MILLPCGAPQSPWGPPTTNRPVGLTWSFVALSMSFLGSDFLDDELDDGLAELRLYFTFSSLLGVRNDDRVDADRDDRPRTRE